MNVNVHQLELFYYVGRYGSFAEASRKMPYGIDSSSLSRQLCRLERQSGLRLYERPFHLTPKGKKLFNFIRPMFEDIGSFIQMLSNDEGDVIRIAASTVVLRDYLPSILPSLRQKFPTLRLTVNEGSQKQIETWLHDKVVDLAIGIIDGEPPADCLFETLTELSLVLLVPRRYLIRSAAELWRKKTLDKPLISLPRDNQITRSFQQELRRRKIDWPIALEPNSIDLVEAYVAKGLGIGVSLALPGRAQPQAGMRALSLPSFPRIAVGMIWQRNPHAAVQALIEELRVRTKKLLRGRP